MDELNIQVQRLMKAGVDKEKIKNFVREYRDKGQTPSAPIVLHNERLSGAGASYPETNEQLVQSAKESFVPSLKRAGKEFVEQVSHPVQLGKDISNVALGVVQKLIPGRQGKEQYIEAIDKYIRDRYLTVEGFKDALANDSGGVALEIASLLTPGSILKKTGLVEKTGKVMGTTIGSPAKQVLGVTTGVGSAPIRKAFQGGKEYRKALHRKTLMEEVVQNSQSALNTIANERRAKYRARLSEIQNLPDEISLKPVREKLYNQMDSNNFDIRRKMNPETGEQYLDFSRSGLDRAAHKPMQDFIELMEDWGSQPGDLTPKGLDTLKKRLDDFYVEGRNSRVIVESVKKKLKETIIEKVPQYGKMLEEYEKYMILEKNISDALSTGKRARVVTSIRSLMSAMKQDVVFRKEMIRKLSDASGMDIEAQIAGAIMTELVPQGFIGRSVAAGGAMGLWISAADPKLWLALTMTSPRIMGEFLSIIAGPTSRGIGRGLRQGEKHAPNVIRGGYITEKIGQISKEREE